MKVLERQSPTVAGDRKPPTVAGDRKPPTVAGDRKPQTQVVIDEARRRGRLRRTRAGLALVLLVGVGVAVAGVIGGGGPGARKALPARPRGPAAVDATAWHGHGSLAFVSRGRLEVVGNDGARSGVSGPVGGTDTNPSWSPGGEWLAYLNTGPGSGSSMPAPTLWLLHVGESTAREVTTAGIEQFAWSPAADVLAFTTFAGATSPGGLWTDVPGAAPTRLVAGPGIGDIAWTPRGTRLAFDDDLPVAESGTGHPVSSIDTVAATGGAAHLAYRQVGGTALRLAAWWPGGNGLLFWVDVGNSASLEATGLSLYGLATGSRAPVLVTSGLAGQEWVAPSPTGPDVAIVAGGDRTLWSPGRDVERCGFPSRVCQKVAIPAGSVGLAPEWTPSGGLIYTVAAAAAPDGLSGGYSSRSIAQQDATSRLYLLAPGAKAARLVVQAGAGVVAAQVGGTGGALLIVRRNGLWLASLSSSTPAVRIAHPLFSTAAPSGYYGEVDWPGTFAWSRGVGSSGGGGSAGAFGVSMSGPSPETP